ncbi:MAG: DUF192 domain-containing protein [Marinibacterium sp.]|nr:DUF192 domain-containing protein [Marinibacterium sp.]
MLPQALSAACQPDKVRLRGDWGETAFAVEIADDARERSRGLMFRDSMPRGAGMLFIYEQPVAASFWMKNTLIPLDMIFVDPTGVVTHIHHNAIPGDLTQIDGGSGVLVVLEINGGLARRYGLSVGDQLQHPAFSDGPAIWPC